MAPVRAGWRNRFAEVVNGRKFTTAFLSVAALGAAAGAVMAFDAADALSDRGVEVTAEVLEVHQERRDSWVVVRFADAHGDQVTADVGNYSFDPKPRVGDRPRLIYDPADPEGNVADVRTGPDFGSGWFLSLVAVVAASLVVPTWTGKLDWNDFG